MTTPDPTRPELQRLPLDYIDTSITDPRDRSLLEVFHGACNSEGGSADEVILRGLKAVLATTTPAGDAGEVGAFKNLLAVGGGCGGGLRLSPDQCRHLGALLERLNAQALQPVPVSERLPDAEDCDAAGKCWFFDPCDHGWWWLRPALIIDNDPEPLTHWLPVHALPLPITTPAGQEGR